MGRYQTLKLAVIGTGYVGLVIGSGFADLGMEVTCVDNDEARLRQLQSGRLPFFEPGLQDLVTRHVDRGRLRFTQDLGSAVRDSQVVFITVGTPGRPDGTPDLSQVEAAGKAIADNLDSFKLIVMKSTAPVGTTRRLAALMRSQRGPAADLEVACNPEFLREGSALEDFMHPNRVIIGTESERGARILRDIYRPLYLIETPFILTSLETAELIKYAANSFLAMKISYINEMANLCDALHIDAHVVANAMGMDRRISPKFLHPGPGFGGSCFPKDCRALVQMAHQAGVELSLVDSALQVNARQYKVVLRKLQEGLGSLEGKTIAIWGLSFKPNTNDIRESTAIAICQALLEAGCKLRAYDPVACAEAQRVLSQRVVCFCRGPLETAQGADAVVLATEWNEFRNLDLAEVKRAMRGDVLVDSRNVYDIEMVKGLGFRYFGVGRR